MSSQAVGEGSVAVRCDLDLEADRHYDPDTGLSMCVTVRSGPGHAVIALAGELDLATIPHLSPVLHGLLAEGRTQITINLDAVTFMDVCALGALMIAHRDVTRAKGSLEITPNRFCERLLATSGAALPPFRFSRPAPPKTLASRVNPCPRDATNQDAE